MHFSKSFTTFFPMSLITTENTRRFLLAGKAIFTAVSKKTGVRFTFRVVKKEVNGNDPIHFVSVMTGPDNENSYSFLGTIFKGSLYAHGQRSKISADATSAKAAKWICNKVLKGETVEGVEIHHAGKCARCARTLTTPQSIEIGIGPECLKYC